ncbi:MAG: ParB N-terminal domain-containing protein [Nitrososphaeria archaeon]
MMLEYLNILTSLKAENRLMKLDKLIAHEETDRVRLIQLFDEIVKDGVIRKAIAIDLNTYIIIDGHHRWKVLKKLGCLKIPVILIDYFSPNLKVRSWHDGKGIPKSRVIRAGLSGKVFPPKTTKHVIELGGREIHISAFEPIVNMPLRLLK